ncbi:MAG: hypothetical protein AAF170_04060 [Bacteroidota bacterium]
MSVQEIETAITQLAPEDVEKLAVWLADYRNREWDQQIGRDLDEGRLDSFLADAEAEYQAGKVRPL